MSSTHPPYTTTSEIDQIHERLRNNFRVGTTRPLNYRRRQLHQLGRLVQENLPALEAAVNEDLGKPRLEAVTELNGLMSGIRYAIDNLEEWARPEKVEVVDDFKKEWDATVYKVPQGVVLVIGPWNYPYILNLGPLVGAIAAGCACVVKPSELAPASSQVMTHLITQYLDWDAYAVVNGAIPETAHLLDLRWDHVLFTGSGRTGRIVSAAAAKHATPVTLELGGKSPVVIADDADLDLAAKRVLHGKGQNSGQLCVCPDHVYVPRAKQDAFIDALLKHYDAFWPKGAFHEEARWGKIINPPHHERLRNLLQRTKGELVKGGEYDGDRRITPTIVKNVAPDDSLMEDELFGPILPLIPVDDIEETIRLINEQTVPLVIYLFTNSEDVKQQLLERTNSGTLVINDTISQLAVYEMPFGGQRDSGHGRWHGKYSFNTFTHLRSHISVPLAAEPVMSSRYMPYTDEKYEAVATIVKASLPKL
ncbi:aldehyde dehydrogenase [Daedalea quercina L-15889]|uniref:Aldehyde dehydrogenase n=1 Tax=Daedalea quercina L-15889 TaxID=1314783 RepID=A0A165R7P5_9APHY|nr:aldehyde dehydrogenase [Daedalea quercina L-15889]